MNLNDFKDLPKDRQKEIYERLVQNKLEHQKLMLIRVKEDVKINIKVWLDQYSLLLELFDSNEKDILRYIKYFNFLGKKIYHQDQQKVNFNIPRAKVLFDSLSEEKLVFVEALEKAMPKVPVVKVKNKPPKIYKINGEMSKKGIEWYEFLDRVDLPKDHKQPVEYITDYKDPNSNSDDQIKDWLFSYGWKPETYKPSTKKDGGEDIPQIRIDGDDGKELCPSVVKLIKTQPAIENLSKMTTFTHRIGLLKGWIKKATDNGKGLLAQNVFSIANTHRYRHSNIVNIPKPSLFMGRELRELFYAPEGYVFVAGDVKSLEDTTKMNSINPYDPEYVKELSDPSYDAHVAIAVLADLMTEDEAIRYKQLKKKEKLQGLEEQEKIEFEILGDKRQKGKTVNFSATYGIGYRKLANDLSIKQSEAKKLKDTYWFKNWSIETFAESIPIKTLSDGRQIIQSQVSKFPLFLRSQKDVFSLHNQNMGRFLFDTYTAYLSSSGYEYWAIYDQHDDGVFRVKEEQAEDLVQCMYESMDKVNKTFNLEIPLQIEPKIGKNLADVK